MGTRPPSSHEIDILVGVLDGCEWKPGEIAERLDVSTEAVRLRRTGKERPLIETVASWVREGIARRVSVRIAQADAQRRVVEKAWRNLEALLDRTAVAADGSSTIVLDALTLGTLREAFDRTTGKAIDRKAVLSQHTEIHQHERLVNEDDVFVDAEGFDAILGEAKRLNEVRSRRLLGSGDEIMEATLAEEPAEPVH